MSQIFEALRRSREQDRQGAAGRRTAQEDAVLATMGFTSERTRTMRERLAPLVLLLLIGVIGVIGWRWYGGRDDPPISPIQSVPSAVPPSSPADTGPPPSSVAPGSGRVAPAERPNVPETAVAEPVTAKARRPARPVNPAKPGSARDPFQLALYYHRSGDFENALMHYRSVLRNNELNPRAHNNLGLLYRDKGLLEDAVREFQRALLIDGRYLIARNNLGVALLGLGRVDEARSQFVQVLADEPRHLDAMVNLALAEKAAGLRAAAMETLVRALAIDARSAAAHYNLAVLYEQSGETSRAIDHYRAFLEHAGSEHAGRTAEVRARVAALGSDLDFE